jgi:hypothetical protein
VPSLPFAQVCGGIQRRDPDILTEKRRATIPSIVQVIARSSFDEAMVVEHRHLRLLESNKKLCRFLDIMYFLLCDDPDQTFRSMIEHSAQSRLRSIFKERNRLLGEILDYQAVLATGMVE